MARANADYIFVVFGTREKQSRGLTGKGIMAFRNEKWLIPFINTAIVSVNLLLELHEANAH